MAAHKFFSDEMLSKIYYYIVLRKKLNLEKPKTFNEKIQWMKLYYYPKNPVVIQCTDKYEVRNYIAAKGYGDKLVPLLGCWSDAKEIDFEILPQQFVLKCNHGCAYNVVVEDKNRIDIPRIIKKMNGWLKEDFGAFNIEIHYSQIKKHLIICEKFLGNDITDYKFFCFNGKVHCVYVSTDLIHDRQAKIGFYNLDGAKMPLQRSDYKEIEDVMFPAFFDEMREASEKLSQDFPFVRVDFFCTDNEWYFAEMTFTPSAGLMPFEPECYDLKWGEKIALR